MRKRPRVSFQTKRVVEEHEKERKRRPCTCYNKVVGERVYYNGVSVKTLILGILTFIKEIWDQETRKTWKSESES